MRIDCQSHVFPTAYAEILTRNPGQPKALRHGAKFVITYGDVQRFDLDPQRYRVDQILRDMDAANVDLSVVSVNMPGPESLAPEIGVEAARLCNDYLADIIHQHPQRFRGLACLPWQEPSSALAELDRIAGDLDLSGVMLYSRVGNMPVDAPELDPMYRRIAELGLPLVLHPTVPPWGEPIKDHSMITMVGLMVEQSFAALRLILGGVLERHPTLKVVQPHCGGVLPYLWGRIENQTQVMGRGTENIREPVRHYYDRFHLDIVSPSKQALQYAYDFAGPDRLLFATDHPWVDIGLFVELVDQLPVSREDRAKIYGENAIKLFRIK